ncbi:toxin-antitoxin system YwqK family antitoxin [Spirosoma pollinicola]|uniref:YD repeat-containing protein n=1 Tax=Spirosoma pollinicola TaxID=2057025 RepID=A0A2K8Z2N1_9BACT|nr:hypothetical protein [Spirosoma pollinicola]AUD04133.1 hypothetical protein CWM47_21235 [Spirosoma pollinicola]
MRYFFTVVSLLLLNVSCREQNRVPPLDAFVTSLADLPTTYQSFQGGSAAAGRLKRETQNGKTTGEWRYNERGQLIEWRLYRFDAVESAVQYRYDKDGRLLYVQQFANNCGYSSVYNCSGPVEWTSYDQLLSDAAGRITESRTYLKLNGNWEFRSKSVYAYNAQGQITNVLRYDAKGVLAVTQTLTYDTHANVIASREQSTVASADLADRTFTYAYDTGRNPYFNTVYYPAALFLSRNTQLAPGLTYDYRADGLPVRIRQNGSITELEYY